MNFLNMVLSPLFGNQSSLAQLALLGGLLAIGLAGYLLYRSRQRKNTTGAYQPARKVLNVGIVTPLMHEAISPEIEKAFRGYMRESIDILASRMGCVAEISVIDPEAVEHDLIDGHLDLVVVDGNSALTFSSRIELMPYYVSSLNALALIFWDKIPHHMLTLQDFASYPNNVTGVIKNSLEEHYASMFDTIKVRRVESLTRMVVDLKLGLARAGLVRMEQAKALKNDYAAIKFMPVSLTNHCFVQDERIALARNNKAFIKDLEVKVSQLRREGVLKKIHAQWFVGLRAEAKKQQQLPESEMIVDVSRDQNADSHDNAAQ